MLGIGIVGLPNVGKSTLFNAITRASVEAANYPFATIDKNVGVVAVPDERLEKLQALYAKPDRKPQIIPTSVEFVDIAGLVKGASAGEGLGNQFLAHIREVAVIAHVVRCFEDENVVHVSGAVDPISDIETINTELLLADIATLERRMERLKRSARGNADDAETYAAAERLLAQLSDGTLARHIDDEAVQQFQLLTGKPVIYVCNVSESDAITGNAFSNKVQEYAKQEGAEVILISARIEEELSQLEPEEAEEFLGELGLDQSGLNRLIQTGYRTLGLITYFTAGQKETRAWTVRTGTKAPAAAGEIHTDFERGFIRAEVVHYDDLIGANGMAGARAAGRLRVEGKEYVVVDGDVIHFLFNV